MAGADPAPPEPRIARSAPSALFGTRRIRRLIVLIVIGVLGYGIAVGLGYLVNPWSLSYPGHPALVGYWSGTMPFGPGDDREVALHLWRYEGGGSGHGAEEPDLVGEAWICGANGASTTYEASGKVLNFQGTHSQVGLAPDVAETGPQPDALEGTWDGADLIRVRTGLHTVGADGAARDAASADASQGDVDDQADVIRFELRRSSKEAFESAC